MTIKPIGRHSTLWTLTVPCLLATLFCAIPASRAAGSQNLATLTASADPAVPSLINAGGSDSVQLHSYLEPTQTDVENLTITSEYWDITSVCESSDDVNWTQVWSGDSPTASVADLFTASVGAGQAPPLECTFDQDNFYMVTVVATANYTATVNGQTVQGTPATSNAVPTGHKIADITKVTVTSGATQTNMIQDYPHTGDQNWGVVQNSANPIMVQVTTDPNTDVIWQLLQWSPAGQAVKGNDNEQSYSAAKSQEYKMAPTLHGKGVGHALNVWVIWATVTIDSAGADPANAPAFPPGEPGGQSLGIQYDAAKDSVAFNNCQTAQMTPAGVHNVVSGGCVMKQERISHDFANGAPVIGNYWNVNWTPDGPEAAYYTAKPDSADKVYAIDGPSDADAAKTSYDTYNNFRDRMEWDGTVCAGYAFWDFQAGWNSSKNPQIYFASGGTGQITLPPTDPAAAVQ